jgi:hypothetical protein
MVGSAKSGREMNWRSNFLVVLGADHADHDYRGRVDLVLGFISLWLRGEKMPNY